MQCFNIVCALIFVPMIPSISYYIFANRVNRRGESSVFIRFTQSRKSTYVNTNIKVPVKFWDPTKHRIKKGCHQANLINLLLDKKMLETKEKIFNQALQGSYITSRKAKESITSIRSNNFFDIADQYTKELKLKGKVGTVDKVGSIFNKFATFMGTKNVSLHDIDEDLLNRYQEELRNKHKNKPNTIHSNLKTIRRIFSIAVRKKLISSESDPFRNYDLKTEKTNRDFLSEIELKRIAELDLSDNPRLEKYRDIFIWTTASGGLRVSDVVLMQKRNYDNGYLHIIIRKTNTPHRIKLPTLAIKIIQKYISACDTPNEFVFDMVPNNLDLEDAIAVDRAITAATASYNNALKEIMKLAGINKQISSHSARITFISLAINMGIDIRTVQSIATHSDLKMTSRYAKTVDKAGGEALTIFQKMFQ